MTYMTPQKIHINNVHMLLTHSIKMALFLLDKVKWVLFIFHIKYFQGNHKVV